jgi:hypothetical protein
MAKLDKYLQARGLDRSDVPNANVFPYAMSRELAHDYTVNLALGRDFILIDYLGPDGKPYLDGPSEKVFSIMRFLGDPEYVPPGMTKIPKVLNPTGRRLELHFEPIREANVSWLNLPDDVPILIVESRIKATAVHKHTTIPCIGLGGVRTWHSKVPRENGNLLNRYSDQVDLTRNPVIVLFDSNVDKKEVHEARDALLFSLFNNVRCKEVYWVDLPKTEDGEDQGPDDFLVDKGGEALIELLKGKQKYTGNPQDGLVEQMNNVAVFDLQTGGVIDRGDKQLRKRSHAKDVYAPINERKLNKNNTVTVIHGFDVWLDHPSRNTVAGIQYKYLGDEYLEDRQADKDVRFYNTYVKDGIWPGEGGGTLTPEAEFIVEHIQRMAGEKTELLRSYVRFLKFESEKPTSFGVLFSDKRGVGKGWFASLVERIVGRSHTAVVRASQFITNFNASLESKRFVAVHEFIVNSEREKKMAMESLKSFIGDGRITIEHKGLNSFSMENYAGLLITCNELSDVPNDTLEDRRMWYINCDGGQGRTEEDWKRLYACLKDEQILAEVAWWFGQGEHIDFSTWRPPLDEDKLLAIRESMDEDAYAYMMARDELIKRGAKATTVPRIDMLAAPLLTAGRLEQIAAKTKGKLVKDAGFIKTDARTAGVHGVGQNYIYLVGGSSGIGLPRLDQETLRKYVSDTNDLFKGG